MELQLTPIGHIRTPYKEKFGIPRQPGLVPAAEGVLELLPEFSQREMLRGLEEFSHLWLIFVFHQALKRGWQATVRPPRLGGNVRQGVFASRSPFRPNHLGLSVTKLLGIDESPGKLSLRLGGVDLVDGTPIVDIKPYLPYVDAVADATGGRFQNKPPEPLQVSFTPEAEATLSGLEVRHPDLRQLIVQVLQQDPRPAYQRGEEGRDYGVLLQSFNIRWQIRAGVALVTAIEPA